jgi:hypothetical protein
VARASDGLTAWTLRLSLTSPANQPQRLNETLVTAPPHIDEHDRH